MFGDFQFGQGQFADVLVVSAGPVTGTTAPPNTGMMIGLQINAPSDGATVGYGM